jgi:acyl-CoA reductase-like NAD-dependent aldehyde dehydrogenase
MSSPIDGCISPIDGSVYAERPTLDAETAFFEVTRARAAQPEWAARPLDARIALVRDGRRPAGRDE